MQAFWLALVALGVGAQNPPLILVPGLTGSALEVSLSGAHMPHIECTTETHGDWMNVWLDPLEVLPREKDCLLARMTLTYDASSDTYSNLPGVQLRARTSRDDKHLDLLYKYEFGTMIKKLESSLHYSLGKDLFLAPYDWRLAGDSHSRATNGVGGFYAQLQALIEKAVQSKGRKAVVLSHSLGCPTILYFFHNYVSEEWRATHIQGWTALSGPWLGSTMQASAYLGGWSLGMPSWLLPHDYVKPVQVNASSGVWLSPNPMAFGDEPVVTTPSKNYTAKDLTHLISVIGDRAGGDQTLQLQKKLSGDLPSLQKPPVNVPMHVWYSTGVKTSERYEYDKEITHGFNVAPIKTHFGDGDGIVNVASALAVERIWPKVASAPVTVQVFPNASHFGMLSDSRVLQALTDYLNTSSLSSMRTAQTAVVV